METCAWSGDAGENGTFSQGDGDHEHFGAAEGGEAGKIVFDVACSRTGDIDKDGIPDGVERFGVRDANGALVADLAALGADPCRPNIVVEIDFMTGAGDGHNHRPSSVALAELRAAFDGAGLLATTLSEDACPYAGFPTLTGGIGLVAVVDDGISEQALSPIDTLDGPVAAGRSDPVRARGARLRRRKGEGSSIWRLSRPQWTAANSCGEVLSGNEGVAGLEPGEH